LGGLVGGGFPITTDAEFQGAMKGNFLGGKKLWTVKLGKGHHANEGKKSRKRKAAGKKGKQSA